MSYVRKVGEKGRYWVADSKCIGCACFRPGEYQVRGGTPSGSRNTGQTELRCMRNAYHGCPTDTGYTVELERERKREGWRNAG